ILEQVNPQRQTLLFSATLDGDVSSLISQFLTTPVTHEVELDKDAPENVHHFVRTSRAERVEKAAELVKAEWPAIVFCRTKHGADRLAQQFEKLGVTATAIHGDRSQAQRERALRAFSTGKAQCLVATDVAARGIHVDKVASVVHFDPPADEKDYIHRSGRTGRAGLAGIVYSLILPEQARASAAMQRRLGLEAATSAERPDRMERGEHRPARAFTPTRGQDRPTSTERAERSERTRSDRPARPTGPRPGGRQARGQANTNWEPRPKNSGGKSYAAKPAGEGRPAAGRPSAGKPKFKAGAPKPGRPGNRKSRRTAA
ncbi:MAG: DEAD/DEAH box helicase, partial [Acidimicrobiales bacterium]|nr:DEAD/DEAH box helicase [Acidimicrobiales bacterium]